MITPGEYGIKYQLRSINPECNVRDIAVRFGGGGHAKAAGYTVQYNLYNHMENARI